MTSRPGCRPWPPDGGCSLHPGSAFPQRPQLLAARHATPFWPAHGREPVLGRSESGLMTMTTPSSLVGDQAAPSAEPSEDLTCIRFHAQPGLGYWHVGILRQGITHAKGFPVLRHGSMDAAKLAAMAWRDEIFAMHPLPSRQVVVQRHRRNNTSGAPGVFRSCSRRTRSNGTVAVYWHWEARTPEGVQPARKKAFSIARYGEALAFELAVRARHDFVSALANHVPEPGHHPSD